MLKSKIGKLICGLLFVLFVMTPVRVSAASDSELLIVYKKDAECSKEIRKENGSSLLFPEGSRTEQVREECMEKVSEVSGNEILSGQFLAGEVGEEGALMQVTLEEGADLEKAIESLNKDPEIAYSQKNYRYQLLSNETNDPMLDDQYYLGAWTDAGDGNPTQKCGANVLAAWEKVKTEHSVTIAVLDSGLQMGSWDESIYHPDLTTNINKELSTAFNDSGKLEDQVGHGTHVAGIAAATAGNGAGIAGASHNASLIAINVVDVDDKGAGVSTENLVKAYTYLEEKIENGSLANLHVINMSLGAPASEADKYDYALQEEIRKMRNEYNVVTVCAGGNDGTTDMSYPSDFDECVSVSALDSYGADAYYSDYNEYKDISAPGDAIWSTERYGSSDYRKQSGSSMAAPLVSGIMALLWAQNPDLTVDQAVCAIEKTAVHVNRGNYDRTGKTGSKGAIDACAAVTYVMENYPSSGGGNDINPGTDTGAENDTEPVDDTGSDVEKEKVKVALPSGKTLTYNGKNQTGVAAGSLYEISGNTGKAAGSYKAAVSLRDPENYIWEDGKTGVRTVTWKIKKAANPLKVRGKDARLSYKKLKKKKQILKASGLIQYTRKGQGRMTFRLLSAIRGKKNFKKHFKLDASSGKLTVKKKTKKGIYKIKVKVKAGGNANYQPSVFKTLQIKLTVK